MQDLGQRHLARACCEQCKSSHFISLTTCLGQGAGRGRQTGFHFLQIRTKAYKAGDMSHHLWEGALGSDPIPGWVRVQGLSQ